MIKPYYSEPGITIYHADCRDILPHLPKVDLVVADPPYTFGLASTVNEGKAGGWGDLMNNAVFYSSWLGECRRLMENGRGAAWVFNSWRSFPVLARTSYELGWPITSLLVWDKQWIGPGGLSGLRPSYELIALFCNDGFRLKNRSLYDIWPCQWSSHKPSGHQAEKPVELIKKIIKESESDTILDPFMGSGTTLVAAKQLGRKAIGIEIEEKYVKIAIDRLRQEVLPLNQPESRVMEQEPLL